MFPPSFSSIGKLTAVGDERHTERSHFFVKTLNEWLVHKIKFFSFFQKQQQQDKNSSVRNSVGEASSHL